MTVTFCYYVYIWKYPTHRDYRRRQIQRLWFIFNSTYIQQKTNLNVTEKYPNKCEVFHLSDIFTTFAYLLACVLFLSFFYSFLFYLIRLEIQRIGMEMKELENFHWMHPRKMMHIRNSKRFNTQIHSQNEMSAFWRTCASKKIINFEIQRNKTYRIVWLWYSGDSESQRIKVHSNGAQFWRHTLHLNWSLERLLHPMPEISHQNYPSLKKTIRKNVLEKCV